MATTVYFIQAGMDGPIKIGIARDVEARLRGLQTGHPDELRLLGTLQGGKSVERALHQGLVEHRIRGEWFRPHADVLAAIEGAHSPSGRQRTLGQMLMRTYEQMIEALPA